MGEKLCKFDFHCIGKEYVEKLLKSLSEGISPGTDNLDGKLLKIAAEHISTPICHIFNMSLKQGVCPDIWKEAKVIPLPKDSKAAFTGTNSRPISLLPVLSKLLEKVVYAQIQTYFSENGLITTDQHAYRKNHSTCTALAQMTDEWLKSMDNKKMVGMVMLDFSAAFDVIDHDILLEKLKCYGFNTDAMCWVKSYLSERRQKVFFNGSFSDSIELQCGVPQGSCLGPLLFSIFTNDLPLVLKMTKMAMYADDSTMWFEEEEAKQLTKVLNAEVTKVSEWVRDNKLVLNIAKTKCMVFGSSHKLANDPQLNLSLGDKPVEQVKTAKLLGITLDPRLSWSEHIDNIVTKMARGTAMTRKCAKYVTPNILNQVIQSLVLSQLDYCPSIWSSAAKKDLSKLQIAQNKAARLALHCSIRTNVQSMHKKLSWLTVERRLKSSLLMFFRNVMFEKQPLYLSEQTVHISSVSNHRTRQASAGHLVKPSAGSDFGKATVINRAISGWNSLPDHLAKINAKGSFKKEIKDHLLALD